MNVEGTGFEVTRSGMLDLADQYFLLGLDPGEYTAGYCIKALRDTVYYKQGQVVETGVWELGVKPKNRKKGTPFNERMARLYHLMQGNDLLRHVGVVGIENAWVGKNPQVVIKLGEAKGWVKMALYGMSRPVIWADITTFTWKNEYTGNPKADKDSVIRICKDMDHVTLDHLPKHLQEHAADATGVASVTYNRINPLLRL